MAGIDYTIPGQFKGIQLESPMNAMAQAMQLRGLQEASQLNALKAQEHQLKMQEYQRGIEQKNALAKIHATPNLVIGSPEYLARVSQEAPDLYEGVATRALQQANLQESIAKRKTEEEKLAQDIRNKKLEEFRTAQKDIAGMNSVEEVIADVQRKKDAGLLPEDHANYILQGLPTDPAQFQDWKDRTLMSLVSAEKQLEFNKPMVLAPGGQLVSRTGTVLHTAPERSKQENKSDLARLQDERAAIAAENPNDPRLTQYDARISKLINPAEHLSDLARKQSELEQLEAELAKDPNNKKLQQRVKEYRDDIRKDTQWKPPTVVVQAPTLSVPAIDMAADRFLTDGTLPTGISKPNRDAIMNRAAAMAKEKGINPDRVAQLEVAANKQALGQLSKTETMVGAFEKNFVKNVQIVENLNAKKDSTGVPLLQRWINVGKKATTGDPDLAALNIAIKAVQNEYGKIVSGSMGNTAVAVSEIKRMEDLLNAAQTPQDVQAVLNTMKAETQNRMAGFKEQRAELTKSMRSSTTAPAAKPNAPAPYTDAEKERRYQEWKAKQGGK